MRILSPKSLMPALLMYHLSELFLRVAIAVLELEASSPSRLSVL